MLTLLAGCQDAVIQNELTFNDKKRAKSVLVGHGVWMNIPKGYKKAKSYDGYQTNNLTSSISVRMHEKSSEQLKRSYDPKNLRRRNLKLIELSDVTYGETGTGFLSVVHDKRKNIRRYLLSITLNGLTYNISSFCPERDKDGFDPVIRWSLESVYIGDYITSEVFKLAGIKEEGIIVYTKDGQFPTKSEDAATIEWKMLKSLDGIFLMGYPEREVKKMIKGARTSTRMENLSNGKYFVSSAQSEEENKKALVVLVAPEKDEGGISVKCYGNNKSNLIEFEDYIRKKLITTTVSGF